MARWAAPFVATFICLGCSDTGNHPSNTPLSTVDGSPSADASSSGAADGTDGAFVANESPLCPRSGPIAGPLPTGAAILYSPPLGTPVNKVLANESAAFVGDQSALRRVSLTDGSVTTLIDHSAHPLDYRIGGFAIDTESIYFTDAAGPPYTPLGLAKLPLAGTGAAPTTILSSPNVKLVDVSGGYVYYEEEFTTGTYQSSINRVSTAGGTPTVILRGVLGGLHGLAVGGGYVYFMGTVGVGSFTNLYLARVSTTAQAPDTGTGSTDAGTADGGAADAGPAPDGSELVATTGLETSGPVTDQATVYWGDEDKLMAAPLTGGMPTLLAQAPMVDGFPPARAVVEGIFPYRGDVYWSTTGCQALRKSSVDASGLPVEIVPRVSALSISANSTQLFFTTPTGQLLSVPF